MGLIRAMYIHGGRLGRSAISPLLVACLAAAPPTPSQAGTETPAEILAIQALVAQVATPRPGADIADFQRELAGAPSTPVEANSDASGPPGKALNPVSLRLHIASIHTPLPRASAVPQPQRLTPRGPFPSRTMAPRPKVERFRMNLTPHAPPRAMEHFQQS